MKSLKKNERKIAAPQQCGFLVSAWHCKNFLYDVHMGTILRVFTLILVFFLSPLQSRAAESQWAKQPHVRIQLLSDKDAIAKDEDFNLGIRFVMDAGWHVYWINPGDSGLPTTAVWELPPGAQVGPIAWPTPERIPLLPLMNYGYSGDELFTLVARSPVDFKTKVKLSWLICRQECIPGNAELSLTIPLAEKAKPVKNLEHAFAEAKTRLPHASASIAWREEGDFWVLALPTWKESGAPYFFSEASDLVEHSAAQEWKKGELWVPKSRSLGSSNARPPVQWFGVVASEAGTAAWRVELDSSALAVGATSGGGGIFVLLLYAFLGGVLLNLMPCVFPVLALKTLGLLHAKHESRASRVDHALFYLLGVLVSFWVLAFLVLAIRSAGAQVGWGFQLQSPTFVAFLCLLLFGFGLNLLGFFEVAGRFVGWGQSWVDKGGRLGIFSSGVLTVLVATPCTAPFMATAMGVALLQPGWISIAIFSALGLGLALPYALLCLVPEWRRVLPKPGVWMQTLKEFLAFPLFATALWLMWVFAQLTAPVDFLWLGAAILLLSFLVWALGRGQKFLSVLGALGLAICAWQIAHAAPAVATESVASAGGVKWQRFSPELLEQNISQGHAVLLDFTAAWCITCQANERLAFSDAAVVERLRSVGVQLLKADWTSYDPVITKALQGYGRVGVPLYVYYAAGSSQPQILPQILTAGAVLDVVR